ncbi:hypothetical protein [Tardiphaga sp. 709]|uniref:hypothetical protein n=1 Tax=Tardiphaga sp. 709 TaxID=3076039 RepID=UPI0028E4A9A4|nr:hypothetical protein [Tardiphaga sp. 709]WNV11553.1 hypothetical protein RSO67_10430 [Tardiphaga sp. 709]
MSDLPLKRRYERDPVDIDEADTREAFADYDAIPLATRARAQASRSLDRCVRLRRTLRTQRPDRQQLQFALKAEQRVLALIRQWADGQLVR